MLGRCVCVLLLAVGLPMDGDRVWILLYHDVTPSSQSIDRFHFMNSKCHFKDPNSGKRHFDRTSQWFLTAYPSIMAGILRRHFRAQRHPTPTDACRRTSKPFICTEVGPAYNPIRSELPHIRLAFVLQGK